MEFRCLKFGFGVGYILYRDSVRASRIFIFNASRTRIMVPMEKHGNAGNSVSDLP